MPSSDDPAVPQEVVTVAKRFQRRERPATFGFMLGCCLAAAIAVASLPFLQTVAALVAVILALRVPLFRTSGTVHLSTDATPAEVRDDFSGQCPPPMAIEWGMGEHVERTDDSWACELEYLFGLASVRLHVEPEPTDDGFVLHVTAADRPRGTYRVGIEADDDTTLVTVTAESNRRFGLRRFPQWVLGGRYRSAAYEALGYTVSDRDRNIGYSV